MAYENLCMYCFEDMEGKTTCPHCGRDSRAAVPQIQMLPGSRVYHYRFLIGRALGQDASGIVYAAFDTKKENRLRIREYLPRDCAERLNDGAVVPVAGMEDQFEAGLRKLRASVESVEDPRKRHFFFEENGTAYIAQRKSAAAAAAAERDADMEDEEDPGNRRRVLLFAGVAVAVLLVAAILLITVFNGAFTSRKDVSQIPTPDPDQVWIPLTTPTPTPYVAPTFAALVDPELSWMDYTYDGDVEQDYEQAQLASNTPTPRPTVNEGGAQQYTLINGDSSSAQIRSLQKRLSELGWLDSSEVTGSYDSATRQAVRDFQKYINEHYNPRQPLSVDGVAGPKTLQWLYEDYAAKPTATPRPKVTPRPNDGTVDENSPASAVRAIQKKLITLGLLPASAADGRYGATTTAAVRRFQRRVNQLAGYEVLEVTGKMDAQSQAFLDYYVEEWQDLRRATAEPTATPKATARPTATPTTRPVEVLDGVINGDSPKEDVRKVQQLLVDIGMLPKGGADGIYGSATIAAVADFQQWVNEQRNEDTLPVNGEVDQLTLLYLQYCKDHGMMPYGTPTPKPTRKPTAEPTAEPLELVDDEEPEEPEEPEGSQEISIDESSAPESIRYVQEMLSAVGALNVNGIDGVYGKGTVSAVKRFQRWVNSIQGEGTLEVTGRVDNRTRLALEYAYDHDMRISDAEAPEEAPTEAPTAEPLVPATEVPEIPTAEPLVPVTQAPETQAPEEPEEPEEPEGSQEISVGEDSEPESISYVQQMLNSVGFLGGDNINGRYDSATVEAVKRFQAWVNSLRGEGTLKVTGQVDDLTRRYLEYAYDHEMTVDQGGGEPEEAPGEAAEVGQVGSVEIAFGDTLAGTDVVTVPEGKVSVRWRAEGDVEGYSVSVQDGAGRSIVDQRATRDTGFTIDTGRMTPGEVYTLRLGVVPKNGTEDDVVWQTVRFMLPEQAPLEPEVEVEPEPIVGSVSAPSITIAGVKAGSSTILIEDDSFQISWSAEGDVETYYVRITDSNGSDINEPQYTTQTVVTLRSVNMEEGELYTLSVGAVPANGTQEDMKVSRAQFMRPVRATPEPTEAPTPEPEVASIGKPVVNVGGTAYQQDGVSYMTGSSIIISWSADGDVENYTIYVENQSGERQELGTTTDTSRTVSTRSLPAGVYTIYVGAMPRGGDGDDVVWGSTRFGIPAPEREPEEEPEETWDEADEPVYEEPEGDEVYPEDSGDDEPYPEEDEPQEDDAAEAEAMSIRGPISGSSDPDTVQQLQMRLYSMGLLSPDGLEPGVLDQQTLRAVAEFQTRMNEQYDAGFDVVDPGDLSSVVDAATVSAIFAS